MNSFNDSVTLKNTTLDSNARHDILAQRTRVYVRELLADKAKPGEVSYILTYIATELGIDVSDRHLEVFSALMAGIGHASDYAARQVTKREEARNAAEQDSAEIRAGSEVH